MKKEEALEILALLWDNNLDLGGISKITKLSEDEITDHLRKSGKLSPRDEMDLNIVVPNTDPDETGEWTIIPKYPLGFYDELVRDARKITGLNISNLDDIEEQVYDLVTEDMLRFKNKLEERLRKEILTLDPEVGIALLLLYHGLGVKEAESEG